jgi:hypothetical protein
MWRGYLVVWSDKGPKSWLGVGPKVRFSRSPRACSGGGHMICYAGYLEVWPRGSPVVWTGEVL